MKCLRFVCWSSVFLVATLFAIVKAHSPTAVRASERPDAMLGGSPGLIFLPAVGYGSGGDATAVAVGDVNGDGKPDLVVANAAGTVGVLLGNGDGTFQTAVTYSTGTGGASSVAIADVNGDGKPDLVVAGGLVSVLMGNGDGTFQPAVTYGVGPNGIDSVAVADVNGDGRPDILAAIGCVGLPCSEGGLSVLLGNGDGTFQAPMMYNSGGYNASSIAVGDLNGDGALDVVVANECQDYYHNCNPPGEAAVFLGNGDGTFQAPVLYNTSGAYANSVTIRDLNGDGKPDLVVGNNCQDYDKRGNCRSTSTGSVSVLLGNGNGTFQPAVNYESGGYGSVAAAVGDVNGDGYPDLVVSNSEATLGVLLGNGDGTFQAPVAYPWAGPGEIAIADVNGDGKPDLLLAHFFYVVDVQVVLNNAGAPPTTITLTPSVDPVDFNQVVAYTASVSGPSGGTLNGSVWFLDGGTPIATVTLADNQATYSTSYSAHKWEVGTHQITAAYSGTFQTAAGASTTIAEYVRGNSKTVLATSGSPSQVGQPVTFTATVTSRFGSIPNGEEVTFYEGKTTLGQSTTTNGVASFITTFTKAKTYPIKATYSGDDAFAPSSGTVKQVVESDAADIGAPGPDAGSSFAAAARPSADTAKSNSNYGTPCPSKTKIYEVSGGPYITEPFNLGATANMNEYCHNVYHDICTGKIFFYLWDDGGWNSLGPGTYQGNCAWQLTTTALPVGNHRLKAIYTEDQDGFGPSSALSSVDVETWPTNTTLTSSPNPSSYKEDVTFTATAVPNQNAPTMPTGKIKFLNGAETLGAVVVNSNGVATLTTKRLPVGTDSITAEYLGDGDNAPSAATLSQVVNSDSEIKKAASDNP